MSISKTIIICLMCIAINAVAKSNVALSINVEKQIGSNVWQVSYQLPKFTQTLDFSHLPPHFLTNHFALKSKAVVKDDSTIQLTNLNDMLMLEVSDGFDVSELRFNAPFINFSNNGAFYADYFVPYSLKVADELITRDALSVTFTITAKMKNEQNQRTFAINNVSSLNLAQFVSLTLPSNASNHGVSFVIEPNLPNEFKVQLEQYSAKFMRYFGQQFNSPLNRDVTFLINANSNAPYIGFLGSALSNQVMFEISGQDAVQHPSKYQRTIYLTLAHEALHLWNAHFWQPSDGTPIWLYEGSADFFAYRAMVHSGLMPQSHFEYFLQQQQKECLEGVKQTALSHLESTPSIGASYPCGRVFFEVLANALNKNGFELWLEIMNVSEGQSYSVEDVYVFIERAELSDSLKHALQDILFNNEKAHNALKSIVSAPSKN